MPPENDAPLSVHESLAAAIDKVEQSPAPAAESASVATPQADTPAAKPADAAPATDAGSGRDAHGRFLKKAGDAPAPEAKPDAAAPAKAADAPAAPAGQPADPKAAPVVPAPDDAPQSWTPDAKAKWATLDPQVKGEIARREREIGIGLQRAAESRKFGDSVMQEFAPYAEILSKEGATPQQAVRALLETSYTLRFGSPEHKHALFMSLAQQYGIDLTKQVDPEKARLEWELDSRKHNDMRGSATAQDSLQREVQSELQTFIDAPGHEHYDTVRMAMAGLMQSGVATSLQDAYDRACWADPTIRAALQMAENAKKVVDQAKNRNALATVNGAPGAISTSAPAVDPTNMRALIESQFSSDARRV